MIPVLSRSEMRAFDACAINDCRVPGLLLMENAGRGAAEVIARELPEGRVKGAHVVVVCGTGNNGGDGFVVARHLSSRGARVAAFLVAPVARLSADARANYDALVGIGVSVVELGDDVGSLHAAISRADVVVDAIFGTGLDRPVDGFVASVVRAINEGDRRCVALDVPSGLDADTGASMGATIDADVTVTFGHYKLGLLTPHGARAAGRVVVVDLGVPSLADRVGHSASLIEREDVTRALVLRPADVHKASAGHVVVFGGSPGHIGAAIMAANAALRAGAGLVTIATWPEVAPAVEARALEAMTARIARDDLLASVSEILEGKRAVVIGPGFGKDDAARSVVEHVLATWSGPSVIDADALSMFEDDAEVFAASKGASVLTPHPGELGRLLGSNAKAVEADRFAAMAEVVDRARSVVVLKGACTLVGAPEERVVINATGNAALATAGSGDVLAGIVGALLCAVDPFEAACAGVYVHGMAGDAWAARHGDRGMLASEIAEEVPAVLGALSRAHTRWSV